MHVLIILTFMRFWIPRLSWTRTIFKYRTCEAALSWEAGPEGDYQVTPLVILVVRKVTPFQAVKFQATATPKEQQPPQSEPPLLEYQSPQPFQRLASREARVEVEHTKTDSHTLHSNGT